MEDPNYIRVPDLRSRDRKKDISDAMEMSLDFVEKLNGLHPDAFDHALFYIHKMR